MYSPTFNGIDGFGLSPTVGKRTPDKIHLTFLSDGAKVNFDRRRHRTTSEKKRVSERGDTQWDLTPTHLKLREFEATVRRTDGKRYGLESIVMQLTCRHDRLPRRSYYKQRSEHPGRGPHRNIVCDKTYRFE